MWRGDLRYGLCRPFRLAVSKNSEANFICSALSDFNIPVRFDAALCLDVLFHLVDDKEWKTSVKNIIDHIKPGGYFLVIEYFADFGKKTPEHVSWRTLDKYISLFRELGVDLIKMNKFCYPHEGNEKTLMVAKVGG